MLRLLLVFLLLLAAVACQEDPLNEQENKGEDTFEEEDASDGDSGDGLDDADHDAPDDTDHRGDSDGSDSPTDADADDSGGENSDTDPNVPDEPHELRLEAVYPSRGPRLGGTAFVLDGEGFTNQTRVLFGSTAVAVDLIDGKLNGVSPPSIGLGPVSIRAIDDERGDDILVDAFTYVEPLHVETVQPSRATVDGGVQLLITGQGFSSRTQITVGDRPVMAQTFLSSTQLRAIAPPHPEGLADVRVTDQDGSDVLNDAIEYIAPVTLNAVDPPVGTTQGGETITLLGSRFQEDLRVFFGTNEATVLQVDPNGDQATVLSPPHPAGLVHVNIQTNDEGATLANAFGYIASTADEAALEAVLPNQGDQAGGQEVYLLGSFPQAHDLHVFFGDKAATIEEVQPGALLVKTPAGPPGLVDVKVIADDTDLVLTSGFRFYQPLEIDTLSPSQGDAQGGTTVTLKGEGFDLVRTITLGGESIDFDIIDETTIEFTTPPSSGGPADLIVFGTTGEKEVLEDAFTYLEQLQIWSHSPTRGSTAGDTYVVLRGQGFQKDTQVFFGEHQADDVTLIDPFNLAVRTPAQSSGNVAVTAQNSADEQALSPEPYTYFNPGAPSGGAWGNPIDGAVNILVYSTSGAAVEGAFVMLSTNAQTPYTGITDQNGMITLSGPDIYGEQTITAVAAEHSSTTVQRVNAENITIFLEGPADGDGVFPPPPPIATFTGYIEGLDKIERPNATQVLLATVYSTRPRHRAQIPDPGANNVVLEDGQFTINTRVGDLALVAIGGLYDTVDGSFTPLRMGVARHLYAADGETYEVEIDLNIPLNKTLQIKYNDPPLASPGPDQTQALLYLDLGLDGVYGPFEQEYITDTALHGLDYVAPLIGDIADASYIVVATTSSGGGLPYVETTMRGIDDLSVVHTTKPLTSTIQLIAPTPGQAPRGGLVQWELHGLHEPDIYYIVLETAMGEVLWEIFLNGSARSFRFPDFPDFSQLEMDDLPFPYPGGTFFLTFFGISKDGVSADNFSYADLAPDTFNAHSVFQTVISF